MEEFSEKSTTSAEIKIVKGTILGEDNEASYEYDLFYWANFIPHFDNKIIIIIGECGFDVKYEKKEFNFKYNIETDTIYVPQIYRITTCSEKIYNRYLEHIDYDEHNTLKTVKENTIPWIRFPRTKDGIIVPELIEKILGRIPNKIYFW